MKNGAFSRCRMKSMYSSTSALVLDRVEQQHELVAADPRQDVGVAQVQAQPLGHLHQQRVADRVSVIVVDVLEIVDVEKRQREVALSVVVLQETVDAMLDHAPRRQAGQFVVIGRAEQVILERLLFGDVGRTRDQQIASGDLDRPMRGEKHLLGRTAGNGFFQSRPGGRCAAIRDRYRGDRPVARPTAPLRRPPAGRSRHRSSARTRRARPEPSRRSEAA